MLIVSESKYQSLHTSNSSVHVSWTFFGRLSWRFFSDRRTWIIWRRWFILFRANRGIGHLVNGPPSKTLDFVHSLKYASFLLVCSPTNTQTLSFHIAVSPLFTKLIDVWWVKSFRHILLANLVHSVPYPHWGSRAAHSSPLNQHYFNQHQGFLRASPFWTKFSLGRSEFQIYKEKLVVKFWYQ